MVDLYRHRAPYAPMIFDHSPSSTLWAIQERFPLSSDCADSPGQDLVSLPYGRWKCLHWADSASNRDLTSSVISAALDQEGEGGG